MGKLVMIAVGLRVETVVVPPSSVVKWLWGVFVCGCGVLVLSCVSVSVSGMLFSVGVCVGGTSG